MCVWEASLVKFNAVAVGYNLAHRASRCLYRMPSRRTFHFKLNILDVKCGVLYALRLDRGPGVTSGYDGLRVNVMNRSSLPNFLTIAIESRYFWCRYRGLPVNDGGRMTDFPTVESFICSRVA